MKTPSLHQSWKALMPSANGPCRSPSVLHAETDEVFRRQLGRRLEEAGWDVHPAPTAQAARQLLQTEAFDLVVVGHGLPGLDGLQLAESLRESGSNTPVIVAAAGPAELREVERVRIPALSAIMKPVDLTLFLSIIQFTLLMERWG